MAPTPNQEPDRAPYPPHSRERVNPLRTVGDASATDEVRGDDTLEEVFLELVEDGGAGAGAGTAGDPAPASPSEHR